MKLKLDKFKEKNYSNISSLITAIIFFIIGSIIFTNPDNVIKFIAYVLGGLFSIIGLINITVYYYKKDKQKDASIKDLTIGTIAFILGLVLIIFSSTIEALIRIIMGAWILFNGINLLVNSIKIAKNNTNSSQTLIVLSILMIICGLYLLLKTNIVFKMLGLYIMIYSTLEIVGYIHYTQNN